MECSRGEFLLSGAAYTALVLRGMRWRHEWRDTRDGLVGTQGVAITTLWLELVIWYNQTPLEHKLVTLNSLLVSLIKAA